MTSSREVAGFRRFTGANRIATTFGRKAETPNKLAMRIEKSTEDEYGENECPPDDFSGVWEIYWRSGGLKFRGTYLDGEGEGEHVCWWEDGKVAQQGMMLHGKCEGIWTDFDDEGHKSLEGRYGPSGKDGLWCSYWKNGQAMKEESYKAGEKHGFTREYSEAGKLLCEAEFRHDSPWNGTCMVIDTDRRGFFHCYSTFKDGEVVKKGKKRRLG